MKQLLIAVVLLMLFGAAFAEKVSNDDAVSRSSLSVIMNSAPHSNDSFISTMPVVLSPTRIDDPPTDVIATEQNNQVNITWEAPGAAAGQWIHYDSGVNSSSIGTGATVDFDVAIRFPPDALLNYAGMSLQALKLWPNSPGSFSARVWTGGTATAPLSMVVDQSFTPVLESYNTVILNTPVPISGTEELWFGMRCNVTGGYPAGCDSGPAVNGYSNLMYFQNTWTTLYDLAPTLNYNWNIQGYLGYYPPNGAPEISLARSGPRFAMQDISCGSPDGNPGAESSPCLGAASALDPNRVPTGYRVWRLQNGSQNSETSWVSLTPNAIPATTYTDTGWATLGAGAWIWAVKALYAGDVSSPAAFSNVIYKDGDNGTIAGIVRNLQNQALAGATVICGSSSTSTNASGAYSLSVQPGVHTVNFAYPGYMPVTETGIVVVSNQTTSLNIQMEPSAYALNDSFETYSDFSLNFPPWTTYDLDQGGTYGFTGVNWPGSEGPSAYMVFNPAATSPPLTTMAAHTGAKFAACFASYNYPNSDWLITPPLVNPYELRFWARSYTNIYGLERFKVGVSTSGTDPNNFTIISGAAYVQAPVEWTEYVYDLSAYSGTIHVGIRCVSNDAWVFMVDDVIVAGGGQLQDPFGNPEILSTSMTVVTAVNIEGQPAANGDVLAAYVNVNGSPQLRGKQNVQVIDGVAGCILQVYTETNGETISFKVWDMSANEVIDSPTTLSSVVNGTVGTWPNDLFMIDAGPDIMQVIYLDSGWNLVSLNVSPDDHSVASLFSYNEGNIIQVKGTEGIYIPGNPYSTLNSLIDGRAYYVQCNSPDLWIVDGSQIPANTPLNLSDGWNLTAYLPEDSLPVAAALSSIIPWLQQAKGTDGIYIPTSPYSTLSTMDPGKGYWIELNGAHNLIYPTTRGSDLLAADITLGRTPFRPEDKGVIATACDTTPWHSSTVTLLPTSMTLLARCDAASAGDLLLARVDGELRGREIFIAPEGFAAALMQIYTQTSGEEIAFSIQTADGRELPLATTLNSEPNATLGAYPQFIILESQPLDGDEPLPEITALNDCFPNPFREHTKIPFKLNQGGIQVAIKVYNLKGQLVKTLLCDTKNQGSYETNWDGTDEHYQKAASGIYFIRMNAGGYQKTIKVLKTK